MTPNTTAIIAPEPFTPRVERIEIREGQTIAGILLDAVRAEKLAFDDLDRVAVYIDGSSLEEAFSEDPDPRAAMLDYVPPAGALINLAVEPLGGGGGGGNKVLQTVLTIAVIAVSMWIGGPTGPLAAKSLFLRTAAAATVAVAGQMAVAAVFSPETEGGGPASDSRALQGASNEFRPRQPFPLQLGRQRAAADLAAAPYTQNIGNDVWLHVPLAWHYGPCTLDAIRIGETLLADYPAADVQVEHFLAPGPRDSALYPGRVAQENFTDELDFTGGGVWEVHTAAPNAEFIEVDVTLPNGLLYNADSGKKRNEEVAGQIQFAEEGTENWTAATFPGYADAKDKNNQPLPPGSFYINQKTTQAIRLTFRWSTPDKAKRYKVRVKAYDRDGDFPDDGARTWSTYWTAIRAIENVRPILDEIVSVTFLRIRSTDDLNGNLPTVTAEVTPIVPVWNGADWSTQAPTSNEAALARWLVTGPAAAKPLRADQVDGSCVDAFNLIEANQWGAAVQVKDEASQKDVLIRLGRAGRFGVYWNGRRLCFVPDWEKVAPRQIFSGRNAAGYRYRRSFPDPVHAIIVEYQQAADVSIMDELIVYADGFDATNAYLFETVRLDFATDVTRAFKEGRAYLAKRSLQVETHEWTAGADSLATTWGDRVLVRHLSTLYGEGEGRVNFRHLQGALVAGVRLDQAVTMVDGVSYSIDVRRADGVIRSIPIQTVPGTTRSIIFAAPRAQDAAPEKGDLVIFGRTDLVTEDVEIVDIERNDSFTANIRAVRYIGEELVQAETGPIPPLQSGLTARASAPSPRILGATGDPSGVVVVFDVDPVRGSFVSGFSARWRRTAEAGEPLNPWNTLDRLASTAREVRTPPIADANSAPGDVQAEYRVDVEIRSILTSGRVSPPAYANGILVTREVLPPPAGSIDFSGVTRAGLDGSTYPALYVAATPKEAGDVQDLVIEVRDVMASADGWAAAGQPLPARNPVGDMLNVQGGRTYDCRARWRTADNWASEWLIETGVYVPPGQTSTDTIFVAGILASALTERLLTVEGIAALNSAAIVNLETIYGDTVSAAASAAAAVEAKSDAIQAKADALIAAGNASDRASEASEERIKAETARGLAESYRNQAADSVTAAGLSAASASEDAGLAATARGEAQGFAGAALDASNAAAGFVTDAEAAAAVSTTQKLEAVAALNAIGRQNIVARENVTTPADVFTVTTAGVSGWGFSMVGSGGVVARDIKVGPLKKNTAYSVSCLARSGGVDPVPLNVDLFPDSLPQTAFNVTSENWSRFTWEGVTSASDDMALATVSLRFFATMPAGNAFEITDIKFEEGATATAYTPSPKDAATSAKASAQSASQAFASQTLAGESAGASETAKLAAQTARGQAEGFKNQAVQAYQDAQGQASIATTQAGLASGSATLAGDKAQAASESASLAATKADAAGTSAQAAEVSKLQAASSYDAAAQILYQQFPPTLAPDSRGSYEGYGSIAGPSDWPTPYISQELTGTISNREFRHKRRIPKVVGKRYRFECWVFTYATNVRFEANLHDFPEATGAGGIRFRRMMSAAPTGSPNIKPPPQTFTLVAGEFEVLSDDQAFLGPYLTAKTDDGQPSNGLTHIGGIAITDITSEKKATTAAEAAIINAASAETFAGQSEDWAEASEEQYLLAKGSAGEAKGFSEAAVEAKDGAVLASSSSALSATASDTARDLSEKARDKALEHRDAASNSAGIAEDKAAEADAFAASASISANLAASTSAVRGNLLPNGGLERGLVGVNGPNIYISNDSWGPAVRIAPTGSGTYGVDWAPVDIFGGATYTVSGDALLFADSGSRYFDMIWLNASGGIVGDSGQKPMGPGDYSNDRARINAMAWTEQAPANAAKVVVRAIFEGVVNPTAMGARRVKLELGGPTATAYTADAAIGALSSQLQITASTTADIATRMATAKFEVIAAAGSDPAQLLIRADSSGSLAAMVAGSIRMSNVVGGVITEVMRLEGGRALFASPISIIQGGRRTTLGPGFGVGGSLHLWSGPSSVAFGSETIDNGILGVSATDGWFGGRNASGPFDSLVQAGEINLPVNAWTTVAQVSDKYLYDQAYIVAALSYEIYVSGAAGGADDYSYNLRLLMTNVDGSNPQEVSLPGLFQFGANNIWIDLRALNFREATISTSRGRKNFYFQINPTGANITVAKARNRRLKGAWTQPIA